MTLNESLALQYMGGDLLLLKELLSYALEIKEERWAEIQFAYDTNDFTCYEIKAHGLKGAMRYLGLVEISDFCHQQELACRQGEFSKVQNNHLQLKEMYDEAHICIKDYLEQHL